MKHIIFCLLLLTFFGVKAQQINPVPDYVFKNQMSVGRNAVTDTAAYFSIGPRYGATKGMMPPMVVDTLTVTGTKRNGLTIFSVQRNKYMYWDSVRVRWSDFAGSSGAYIFASDTASMLSPYLRKVDTTAMLTNYTIGSGTTNYLTKFTGSRTLGNSGVFESGSSVGIGTTSPLQRLHVFSNSTASRIALTGGASNNQGSAISFYQSNNSSALLNIGDKAAITGGAVDTAVVFRAGVNIPLIFEPNADESFRLSANGTVTAKSLAGTGSRIVVANASGTLSASSALSGYVDGSGTTNYVPKFTATSTIGNSIAYDNGTELLLNTTTDAGAYALQVNGNIYTPNDTYTKYLYLASASASAGYVYGIANSLIYGQDGASGINIYAGDINNSISGSRFMLFANDNIRLHTAASERMRITSTGNVGIGTSTPDARLDVANTITSDYTSAARFRNSDAGAGNFRNVGIEFWDRYTTVNAAIIGARNAVSGNWQGDLVFKVAQGASPSTDPSTLTEVMRFHGQSKRIQFLPDGTERMRLTSDAELIINTTTDAGAYALQVAGSIYNTTGAVFAASSGNVGIGTASPSNILHVNGGSGLAIIRVSEAGTDRGFLGGANGMISGYTNEFAIRGQSGLILSGSGNAVNAYINSSAGELIIANGNTDAGDYKLQVAGNIYNTGNITTGAPTGGTATAWRLGEVATVSPTSPNRTIRVEIGSQVLYIHAKTTND